MLKKVSFLVIIGVVIIIAYNFFIQISEAVRSQERLSAQADKVYKLEAKNSELRNKLSQTESKEFIEEQARNKLNLAKEGETIVVIPKNKLEEVLGATSSVQEIKHPNWLGWWRVFFR